MPIIKLVPVQLSNEGLIYVTVFCYIRHAKFKSTDLLYMSALVTCAKSRIAYNIVRNLGEKGIKVYTADSSNGAMSFASRYSARSFIYPSPYTRPEDFIDYIINIVNKYGIDVVIPAYEETFLLSKYKNEISRHVKLVLPDYEKILLTHNKDRLVELGRDAKISVPLTITADDIRNDRTLPAGFKYPVLAKPKQGGGAWGIVQFNDRQSLEMALDKERFNNLPWSRYFIQEKIDGDVHCVAMLFNNGQYRASVSYIQLRDYPVTGGQATLRVSISNPKAEDDLKRLLEHLQWHGICQVDFVVEKKTGECYLIDINPRFWGSLTQGIASGVDFPYLLYKIAVDGDVSPVNDFRAGVKTRWLGGDIRTFLPLMRSSNSMTGFLSDYIRSCRDIELYDDFGWKDPMPFFAWMKDSVMRVLRNLSMNPPPRESLKGVWK
ncbi:MAG: ATP-grasp domain-containing protein [candidate division Zixibacteria bacterium]|nr:ATP-grasp domain-containing protein [candidate division Zixibacteria bacterium]